MNWKSLLLIAVFGLSAFSQSVVPNRRSNFQPPPAGGGGALTTSLIAYWKLEEASGTRNDSVGVNHLTDNNTVLSGTGKISNAADFENASDEWLSKTGTWAVQTGDFTVSVWCNAESLVSTFNGLLSCRNGDAVGDWVVTIMSSGAIRFYYWTSAGNDPDSQRSTGNIITTGSWYHIVCRVSSGVMSIWVNGASQGGLTTDDSGTGWGTVGFEMGRSRGADGYYYDGLIDEAGIWSRALTDGEIAQLYNSGTGITLP